MVTENELLEVCVSVPVNVADPFAENVPACSGTKLTFTSSVCPPGKLERLQVSVPPELPAETPLQVPWLVEASTNWKVEGNGNVKTTFDTAVLPVLFLICQVKVSPVPTLGPPFCAEPFTSISALTPAGVPPPPPPVVGVVTFVVELATLFPPTVSMTRFPDASLNCTEAVFVMDVLPVTTVTVTRALAPAFRPPRLQVKTAPVCVHTP